MKRSDLKTGMRVQHRNGDVGIIFLKCDSAGFQDCILYTDGWRDLSDHDENDLKCKNGGSGKGEWDIVKVFAYPYGFNMLNEDMINPDKQGRLLWELIEQSPEAKRLAELQVKLQEIQAEMKVLEAKV